MKIVSEIIAVSSIALGLSKSVNAANLQPPLEAASSNGILETILNFQPAVFNSDLLSFNTRAYDGKIPGKTLRLKRGDTLKIHLKNWLGDETEASTKGDELFFTEKNYPVYSNRFKLPNTTNIHFHGLHVSPHGNSDNVMGVRIDPGTSTDIEVKIPVDHPSGTFFYHPHFHGSVSVQVGGGAVGALIIEDDISDTPKELQDMKEHILLLQHLCFQIQYFDGTMFGDKKSKHLNNDMTRIVSRSASEMPLNLQPKPDPYKMGNSLNSVHVNGQWMPSIKMRPGETARYRIINGGAAETMVLALHKNKFPFPVFSPEITNEKSDMMGGLHCVLSIIAMDGIYLTSPNVVDYVHLVPGSRADVAVHCPKSAGTGRLILGSQPNQDTADYIGTVAHIHMGPIAFIDIEGPALDTDMPVPNKLPGRGYLDKLEGPIDKSNQPNDNFEIIWGRDKNGWQWAINGKAFDENTITASTTTNKIAEWKMGGDDFHPFHLHTHHFKMIQVPYDNNPTALKVHGVIPGSWRDTIPTHRDQSTVIRFIPTDWAGVQMAHCHVPSHADQGMAMNFAVEDPSNQNPTNGNPITYAKFDRSQSIKYSDDKSRQVLSNVGSQTSQQQRQQTQTQNKVINKPDDVNTNKTLITATSSKKESIATKNFDYGNWVVTILAIGSFLFQWMM